MSNRVLKVLALLVALTLALGMGAVAGGGAVYMITKFASPQTVVSAQEPEADPELGIVIAEVEAGGPAAEAGVVRGDILQKIDGHPVDDMTEALEILQDLAPGDEVELTVLHGDDLRVLTAILGARGDQAYLGLVPCGGLRPQVNVHLDLPGALLVEVMPDSPAKEAGLEKGDVIVAVDGQTLDAEHSLADIIAGYEPGDRVGLEVQRPGEEEPREVTVELGEHPDEEDKAYLGVRYSSTDALSYNFPEGEIEQGAIVGRVIKDSPASAAGLKRGDVITAVDGKTIQSSDSLIDLIAEREPGDEITLEVYRAGDEQAREIVVTLGEHPDEEGKAYLGVTLGGFLGLELSEGDEGEWPYRFRSFRPPFDFDFDPDEWSDLFKWDRENGGDWLGWFAIPPSRLLPV